MNTAEAVILYDSLTTGHHPEYISHLARTLAKAELSRLHYFIVAEDYHRRFPAIVALTEQNLMLHWVFIPDQVTEAFCALPLWKRSFAELELLEVYTQDLGVKKVFLLYLDIFQLALLVKKPSFDLSGILFIQPYRLSRGSLSEKFRYVKRMLITRLYARRKQVKELFILNDQEGAEALNRQLGFQKFAMLPDPIPELQAEADFDLYAHYAIPREKVLLLHPGSIHERKGTFEIVEAMEHLPSDLQQHCVLLIVGKADAATELRLREKIAGSTAPVEAFRFENTFVSDERLAALFAQCDAVLVPYKNTESSSGIVGHAAAAGKPVLATNKGLLADLVRSNALGVLIQAVTPEQIAAGIARLADYRPDADLREAFVASHRVADFTACIVNSLT